MAEYSPDILNKYSQRNMSNTSISTFGSKSSSRKHSLTPIDVTGAIINLRRRSFGYENINDDQKIDEEPKHILVEENDHPRLEKVDSSSEFLSSFKVSHVCHFNF